MDIETGSVSLAVYSRPLRACQLTVRGELPMSLRQVCHQVQTPAPLQAVARRRLDRAVGISR